jgi:serine protease Do
MKSFSFRTLAVFTIGIVAGFFLYLHFTAHSNGNTPAQDSLLVENLYASTPPQVTDEIYKSRQNSITRAVERLSPAVVGINVVQEREIVHRSPFHRYREDPYFKFWFPELFEDRRFKERSISLGSGFIISSDGYLVTNEHVVESAKDIEVIMTNGTKVNAEIVGTDPISDVALLKIDLENLPFAKFGDSDQIILGEWAIAIGNPFGLFEINSRATVTVGVISALNRDFGELEGRMYQDMIQTDASINHGNSGGPLCNAIGEVIGMNSFIYAGGRDEGSVGIGFAIPINRITNLIDDLKENEVIDRDFWIGIRVQNLDERIADAYGYDGVNGVIISYIDRRSPAEKAGLELGDILMVIGKHEIMSTEDVSEAIFEEDYRVGDKMPVKFWREGKVILTKLELVKLKN